MKHFLVAAAILISLTSNAQRAITPTDTLFISGKIKHSVAYTLPDLAGIPTENIKDIAITNHLGEKKGNAQKLKGFLVKKLFDKIEFDNESPKTLSEFYFTFIASDSYKVVFSWNEIFNTEIGDHLYLVTSKDGKKLTEIDTRILVVSTKDFQTGRRYIKALSRISVNRAE